ERRVRLDAHDFANIRATDLSGVTRRAPRHFANNRKWEVFPNRQLVVNRQSHVSLKSWFGFSFRTSCVNPGAKGCPAPAICMIMRDFPCHIGATGDGRTPGTQASSCAKAAEDRGRLPYVTGFFQMGTTRFISSMSHWPAAKASPRCGAMIST